MSLFERFLTLWVALCIVAGIALGHLLPGIFHAIGSAEIAHVNLPVAVLIWLMIIPMLIKIDFGALGKVREHWRGIGVTLFINWAVKPFSMAALGWLFIGHLFAPYLPADQINSYIAGLILLAAAPCTAMVFVWSNLSDGEPHFTLSQVALNDTIMVFAFAPIVGLLLGISAITVPWETLLLSVGLYIVVPVLIAQVLRKGDSPQGRPAAERLLATLQPVSLVALLRDAGACSSASRASRSSRSRWSSPSSRSRSSSRSISTPALPISSTGRPARRIASPHPRRSSARATSLSWPSPLRSACSDFRRARRSRLWSAC